jgi:hypothetical protein
MKLRYGPQKSSTNIAKVISMRNAISLLAVALLVQSFEATTTTTIENTICDSETIKVPWDDNNNIVSYTQTHRSVQNKISNLSPYYYDELRLQIAEALDMNDESFVTVQTVPNSSIYRVTLYPDQENSTTYRFTEIKSFIAFSNNDENNEPQMLIGTQNEAYAALLAMYHFNNMETSMYHPVVEDHIIQTESSSSTSSSSSLYTCNVKLTMELIDSTYSPTIATQTIASIFDHTSSIAVPETTAVVSSSPTTVTLPLAIFTGIYNVPFISATATSNGFDDKEQFPLFGRTVTNADGVASASLQFFQSIQSSHVAILFVSVG